MSGFTWGFIIQHIKQWGILKWLWVSLFSLFFGFIFFSPLVFFIVAGISAFINYLKINKTSDIQRAARTGTSLSSENHEAYIKPKGVRFSEEPDVPFLTKLNLAANGYQIVAKEYAFIDLETTGLEPENGDKIIEIGIMITDAQYNEIARYETLVNPNRPLSASHIHLITEDMINDAPYIQEINDEILSLLDGRLLVAHNAEFERKFLNNELNGTKLKAVNFLDTLEYARQLTPTRNHKLQTIADYYKVDYSNAHTAMADTLILRNVLSKMLPAAVEARAIAAKGLSAYKNNTPISNPLFDKWISRKQVDQKLNPIDLNYKKTISEAKIETLNEVKQYVPEKGKGNPPWWRTLAQKGEIGIKIISRKIYHENLYSVLGSDEQYWEGKPVFKIVSDNDKEYIELYHKDNLIGDIPNSALLEKPFIKELLNAGRYRASIHDDFGPKLTLFLIP
jgi:DNA polymerase-3 subunit epsilon